MPKGGTRDATYSLGVQILSISCIFTVSNEVAKVMFLHVSVILFTRGGLPQCMLGYSPGPGTPPQDQAPPGSRHPPEHTPPEQTPQSRPPGTRPPPPSRHPQGADTHPRVGYCCGRYASYWNAFLLEKNLQNRMLAPSPGGLAPPLRGNPGSVTAM